MNEDIDVPEEDDTEEGATFWTDPSVLKFILFCWICFLGMGTSLAVMYKAGWFERLSKPLIANQKKEKLQKEGLIQSEVKNKAPKTVEIVENESIKREVEEVVRPRQESSRRSFNPDIPEANLPKGSINWQGDLSPKEIGGQSGQMKFQGKSEGPSKVVRAWANDPFCPIRENLTALAPDTKPEELSQMMLYSFAMDEVAENLVRHVDFNSDIREGDAFSMTNWPNTVMIAGTFDTDVEKKIPFSCVVLLDPGKQFRCVFVSIEEKVLKLDNELRARLLEKKSQ